MPLQLSDLRSDFTLTLGYLNLALNNMALDSSIYVTNLTKYTTSFKNMFRQFFCHLQLRFIQKTKNKVKSKVYNKMLIEQNKQ